LSLVLEDLNKKL